MRRSLQPVPNAGSGRGLHAGYRRVQALHVFDGSASLSYLMDTFGDVPRIAAFYGIVIFIYSREHGVPHFHARHGDHEAVVAIESGEVLTGGLPRREGKLVAQWWDLHQAELADAWRRASSGHPPGTIEPLP